ncbi:MAG: diguanylate cyclase [Pseudomonadota bacterium]
MRRTDSGPDEAALRAAIDSLHEGLALIDTSVPEWHLVWFNAAFASLTVNQASALGSDSARELLDRLGGAAAVDTLRNAIAAAELTDWPIECDGVLVMNLRYVPLADANGVRLDQGWLMLRAADAGEALERERSVQSELAVTRRRLRDLSDDPATGLAGEQRFREILRRDFAIATRQEASLSLIALRMDAYDAYRATFGEHATDSCLRMLARTVSRRLRRGSDLAGRAGADCLVLLVQNIDQEATEAFSERIAADIDALRIHHPKSDSARYVTVSHAARALTPGVDEDADVCLDELLGELGQQTPPPALLNQA